MKRHYASRHEQSRPHDCPGCDKSFSRKFLLTKHLERHHPDLKTSSVKRQRPDLNTSPSKDSKQEVSDSSLAHLEDLSVTIKLEVEDYE